MKLPQETAHIPTSSGWGDCDEVEVVSIEEGFILWPEGAIVESSSHRDVPELT